MLVLHDLGRRLGRRRIERDPEGASAGAGVIDGAVFALLGLLGALGLIRVDAADQVLLELRESMQ